jgi:hypothetical protein
MSVRAALLASAAAAAMAASPLPNFRPPATPLLSQSPLINAFSACDTLNGCPVTQWTGQDLDFTSFLRVDGAAYLVMGDPNQKWAAAPLPLANQTSLTVFATQTVYTFSAGPIALTLTFTTPQIAGDYDLMSRPCHYFTYTLAATDGATHAVALYQDLASYIVQSNGKDELIASARVPLPGAGAEALSLGSVYQTPLSSTNDKATWGVAYLARDTTLPSAGVLTDSYTSRQAFFTSGALPPADAPTPAPQSGAKGKATGPQPGIDRSGSDMPGSPFPLPRPDPSLCWARCNATAGCLAWAYAVPSTVNPSCAQFATPQCWLKGAYGEPSPNTCRVSGAQDGWPMGGGATPAAAAMYALPALGATPVTRVFMVAVDEILGIDWFGESMPPWWRRALPVNSTTVVPVDMLSEGWSSATAVKLLCDNFDAETAARLSASGGDEYATVSQLTYRQVWAGQMLGEFLVWGGVGWGGAAAAAAAAPHLGVGSHSLTHHSRASTHTAHPPSPPPCSLLPRPQHHVVLPQGDFQLRLPADCGRDLPRLSPGPLLCPRAGQAVDDHAPGVRHEQDFRGLPLPLGPAPPGPLAPGRPPRQRPGEHAPGGDCLGPAHHCRHCAAPGRRPDVAGALLARDSDLVHLPHHAAALPAGAA